MPKPEEIIGRLQRLRNAMLAADCTTYIIPASDPHASEYMPAHFNTREYYSGFPCENSVLVVTLGGAALWVDGRYYVAAEAALAGTGIELMRQGTAGVPTVEAYCAALYGEDGCIAFCADTMPMQLLRKLQKATAGRSVRFAANDFANILWEHRPALPTAPAYVLDARFAGRTPAEKLAAVRAALAEKGCTAMLVNRLDSVAWLCNLRGADIAETPYALAFCWVGKTDAALFLDAGRLVPEGRKLLEASGFTLHPYREAAAYVAGLSVQETVLADETALPVSLFRAVSENSAFTIVEGADPVQLLKAVKNETELACTRKAHLRDAVCMVRFQMQLEAALSAGKPLRENDVCEMLYALRSADPDFIMLSFAPIAAYGPNAAMMHYAPTRSCDSAIEHKGFLLVDSGTTCRDGTTDITRTYAVGPLTDAEKADYTCVLRCHIDMARAVWKAGATGGELDMLARQPLWARMLDYRCGTGHGVAHVGSVHEGPQSLRPHNSVAFLPGMIVTDEPGLYEGGQFGIRIENELECCEAGETEYGRFLRFTPLTYVPIDTAPIVPAMLTAEELSWLNAYHAAVYEKLSPLLTAAEAAWLKTKCAPLSV